MPATLYAGGVQLTEPSKVEYTVFSHCHQICPDLNNKSQLYHTEIHLQVLIAFND